MSETMIKAEGLTMHYGSVVALNNATFEVQKGEVVGLLGPNGAGKSTTMKILTTYLYPTGGSAMVGGKSVTDHPIDVRRMIGYLPEILPLYMNMEVAEYLQFVGKARGICGAALKQRLEWVVEHCGLKAMYRRPIRELSKGYKQRTGLGQALIHDPDVVILDEPTSGLDPHQILEVRELVRTLAESKTVILSTHILQEAQAMADRIIIINRGQLVGQGSLDELREKAHETNRVRLAVKASRDEVDAALSKIDAIKTRTLTEEKDGICSWGLVGPDDKAILRATGELIVDKKFELIELASAPYTLEETFLALTESDAEAKGGAA